MILLEDVRHNKEKWKLLRKGKIGASSAYDAANIDEGSNPLRVWSQLVSTSDWEESEPNGWSKWGLRLEDGVGRGFCEDYEEETGSKAIIVGGDALYQHDEFPWAVATPDFLVNINGELVNVQTKTRTSARWKEYQNGIPNSDRAQVLHELGVLAPMGIKRAFLAVFFYPGFSHGVAEPTLKWFEVPYEQQWIDELFRREQELWEMAQKRVPPAINFPGESALARFWEHEKKVLDFSGDEAFLKACEDHRRAREKESEAQEEKSRASGVLLESIANAYGGRTEGCSVTVVRKEFTSIDTKRLKATEPTLHSELLQKYPKHNKSIYPLVTWHETKSIDGDAL